MEKEFCTYNQALRLKALGFNEPCFAFFNGKHLDFNVWDWEYPAGQKRRDIGECPLAPTFSQSFRWFREKYKFEGIVQQAEDFTWYKWKISQYNEDGKKYVGDWYEYNTYEEAELACLDKLLEIVKSESE